MFVGWLVGLSVIIRAGRCTPMLLLLLLLLDSYYMSEDSLRILPCRGDLWKAKFGTELSKSCDSWIRKMFKLKFLSSRNQFQFAVSF